jgi:N-acyl-D-amino-acid deacylase
MPMRLARPVRCVTFAILSSLACAPATQGTSGAPAPAGERYDVIIRHGRIVDGTGNPWYDGDVAIRGDRIARVARAGTLDGASATTVLDARGLVVAPGFIDIQSHSWTSLLRGDGRVLGKVHQGVTSEILGEAFTPAPLNERALAFIALPASDTLGARLHRTFFGAGGFGRWLEAMERHGNSVNVGSYLGAETVRVYAKGESPGAPSAAELDSMRQVVRWAMEDGAFGISSALIYPPGSYAATPELIESAKAMAPFRGAYITHMRSEEEQLLEAIDEALRIGREGGVPVTIYHLKAAGKRNWWKATPMVAKIDSARAAGQDVTATMYPYPASGNNLSACIPAWASADGKLLANLRDPAQRARVASEMRDTSTTARAASSCPDGPEVILVAGFTLPELKQYEGLRLNQVADSLRVDWVDALIDLTLREENRLSKITFSMNEENVAMQLRRPWVSIGSDAGGWDPEKATGLTHPRAYGTYPRILGRYVREWKVLTLEDAIRKMTSAVADQLALRDRGLLREGLFADVVIFDPATIIDNATWERPHQLSTGVRHVFVNGVAVLKDGTHTGAKPGRALRGPGWRGSR